MLKEIIKKIPGFRTGEKWKMTLTTLEYLAILLMLFNPIGATLQDKIIYIFELLIFFGVLISLLANVGHVRSKLPLFKKNKIGYNILGGLIVIIILLSGSIILDNFKSLEQKQLDALTIKQSEIRAADKAAADKAAADKAAADKAAADKAAADKAAADKAAADKAAADKAAADKAAADKAAASKAADNKPNVLSETQYKEKCVDLPWAEVVKDRKTYVGTYLKKNLMVRLIGEDNITGETVYICGENKGGNNYAGGTFTVYDRRGDKTHPIDLYDKIYVYGQIKGIYLTYSSYNPEYEVKYVQFNGRFGE